MASPRVIDQDVPHDLSGDGEEMRSILPLDFLLPGQAQIRFVNQRGRAQRGFGAGAEGRVPRAVRIQSPNEHWIDIAVWSPCCQSNSSSVKPGVESVIMVRAPRILSSFV